MPSTLPACTVSVGVTFHQQISQTWWATREDWDLCVSALVVAEARSGDTSAAERRLASLGGLPLPILNDAATDLAERLLTAAALPPNAREDALHVALATVHGVDYLLTWNCKHIANAEKRPVIDRICNAAGFRPPIICTPEELLGDRYVD